MNLDLPNFINIVNKSHKFNSSYSVFPNDKSSPFALVFLFLIIHALDSSNSYYSLKSSLISSIRLDAKCSLKKDPFQLISSKKSFQLLCFQLTALYTFSDKDHELVRDLCIHIFSILTPSNVLPKGYNLGVPGTGNFSMFTGVILSSLFLLFNYLPAGSLLSYWVESHLSSLNKNIGLWSASNYSTHAAVQNSYHQFEIFKFLEYHSYLSFDWSYTSFSALQTITKSGSFSPYFGGSACYDYDSLFLIQQSPIVSELFSKFECAHTYSEHVYSSLINCSASEFLLYPSLWSYLNHFISSSNIPILFERIKFSLKLLIYGSSLIRPHWCFSQYDPYVADLWSYLFRLYYYNAYSTMCIQSNFLSPVYFPGIGFHTHE